MPFVTLDHHWAKVRAAAQMTVLLLNQYVQSNHQPKKTIQDEIQCVALAGPGAAHAFFGL
jgi:hypothetical protein